jgi:uncharacterized protein YdhG (YjbR/CyaY superfamily)
VKKVKDVDSYISSAPDVAKPILSALRRIVRSAAPKAEEKISYGMPYYGYKGRLIYFAAHKDHVGLYILPAAIKEHKNDLKDFVTTKGGVQLPYGRPIPSVLIRKMVMENAKRNELRSDAKTDKS